MAANYNETRIYNIPFETVIYKLDYLPAYLKYQMTAKQQINMGMAYSFSHGISFTSWGESITINVFSLQQGTQISIWSECSFPTQLIDWGKNRSNVDEIFNYIASPMYYQ